MLSSLICGAGSFHQEEEEEIWIDSPYSSPRKSRKKSHGSKSSKNPYSTRGLDKFSALLADLEEKRQKIYLQADSQDISFVRFVHSSSNDWKPIVVKSKDKKEARTKKDPSADLKEVKQQQLPQPQPQPQPQQPRPIMEEANEKAKMSGLWWNMEMGKWRRPSYYLPVAVIFILLLLLVFGRSFAILCTSLGWYVVPNLKESENTRKSTKKKEYVRGLSENKMVMISAHTKEYTRSKSGDVEGKSTRPRGHQKSW
ncbi:uncharacterized protein LOC132190300 [Corylus avellana]|uniref:uncharacterized protein LOC132190300 n=1 Tax=Corylus avellana TaxID=13451 RepID=UPI00286BCD47|nr:uncharacterized protein LOC132190300 [Corylus avellana]